MQLDGYLNVIEKINQENARHSFLLGLVLTASRQ